MTTSTPWSMAESSRQRSGRSTQPTWLPAPFQRDTSEKRGCYGGGVRSAYQDYADGIPIQLERGWRAHGLGWGYEGVIRRVGRERLPSGREIATENVLTGCGHGHASYSDACECPALPVDARLR